MKRKLSLSLIIIFTVTIAFAQKKVKYGKIEMVDLEMTSYPTDSSAAAAILFDKGATNLDYEQGLGAFQYIFERHLRIKILDKSGLEWADFAIGLHENGRNREKVNKFNGTVYTLKNGKVEKTEVKKSDLLTEKISENYVQKKIAFPKVQVGSIIEIKYSINSPFYSSLVDWQFQYQIPVRYNEYEVNYPEWFTYKTKFKGYDLQYISILDLPAQTRMITFRNTSRGNSTSQSSNQISYSLNRFGWVVKEMPSFKKEAYISTIDNFLVSVDFELSSTNLPGSTWTSYSKSWEELGKTMMDSPSFGKQITKGKTKFISDEVNTVIAGITKPKEKISALYYHLKSKMAWNDYQNTFVSTSLKEAYKKGKGSTADINLTLLAMLRQAGFVADPVLLSTKGNGFLNTAFPALRQFNYVIVRVEVTPQKYMLLDATDKDLPIHLLPTKCINDQGLLVREKGIKWVDLKPTGKYNISRAIDLSLNEDMEWEGKMKIRCRDYAAYSMRENYTEEDNEKAYIATIESDNEGLSVEDFTIEGVKKIGKGLKESCNVNFSNQVMDGGDLIYFNPMLTFASEENPFKLKKRAYPVDYPYPQSKVYSIQFAIPEGYVVDELPEKTLISLPENSGMFSYTVKVQGGKIMALSQFKINKNLFLPEEYPSLKEFYNIMIAKHSEQVVLKKS